MQDNFLFIGLTHIGQVYSICWAKKFKKASVYDFEKGRLFNFKKGNITPEEPDLWKLYKKNKKKIKICKYRDIPKYKNIFFTIDTKLNFKGQPCTKEIELRIKQLSKIITAGTNLFITSQLPPGFCKKLNNKFFSKKKIQLIYMVDTLEMGNAVKKFLKPKMIVFGSDKKNNPIFQIFKKFNCPLLLKTFVEAETVKMAINLYLLTSVSYANALDYFCNENNFKFSSIADVLRLDKRIGLHSYINPSLGVSGGHLERDFFNITRLTKNQLVKNFFLSIRRLDLSRIDLLTSNIQMLLKEFDIKKICWMGISYKKESFSIKNSAFIKFYNYIKYKNKDFYVYDSYFSLMKYNFRQCKDLKKIMNERTLIIHNYSTEKDKKILKYLLKKNKYIKILNISFSEKLKLNNVINLFN
jgi:UDPglucose 6-dehydrogenase